MEYTLNKIPTFGVAGNFTGHLEQAGEAKDFVNVKTAEVNAPKAIFPTFIPGNAKKVPEFLHTFPFDSKKIIYPAGEDKLQIEPECAIICNAVWNKNQLIELKPILFGASNDCSIRKDGAKKISQKKNWGSCSKGFAENLIKIDSFAPGGILDNYRIASFLVRDGKAFEYGENSPVKLYSYFYKKLLDWCLEKFNNQKDEGPAENIHQYLIADNEEKGAALPQQIFVSVGATRYTEFGKTNFLQKGDFSVVVVYPETKYSPEAIKERVCKSGYEFEKDISVLIQKVETA